MYRASSFTNLDAILTLFVDAFMPRLRICDEGNAAVLPTGGQYMPGHLRAPVMHEDRARVRENLRALRYLMLNKSDPLPFSPITEKRDLGLVITALLYAERQQKAFFEMDAVQVLEERLKQDGLLEATMEQEGSLPTTHASFASAGGELETVLHAFLDGNGLTPSEVSLLKHMVKYHKIACLAAKQRLSKQQRQRIADEGEQLSLGLSPDQLLAWVAAAAYDTPRDHPEENRRKGAWEVLKAWYPISQPSGSQNSVDSPSARPQSDEQSTLADMVLEHFIILYDLPLCDPDTENYGRGAYNENRLKKFVQMFEEQHPEATEKEPGKCTYLTVNQTQARLLSFTPVGPEPNIAPMCCALDETPGPGPGANGDHYEFKKIPFNDDSLLVWEFRLKESEVVEALTARRGLNLPSEWFKKLIADAASPSSAERDGEQLYVTPLPSYIALPSLLYLLRYAAAYKGFGETPSTLSYECGRLLDLRFDGSGQATLPAVPGDTILRSTLLKYLGGLCVNVGMIAGLDHIQTTVEAAPETTGTSGSDWRRELNGLLRDTRCGFELMIRYIETYMRSIDVAVPEGAIIDELAYYEKLRQTDDTNKPTWAVGIDIGATAAKFTLYKLAEKEDTPNEKEYKPKNSYNTAVQKEHGNTAVRYATLGEFAKRLAEGLRALCAPYMGDVVAAAKADDLIVGVCWPGPIRDQRIAGASGICRNFEETIVSNLIRRCTVEGIRRLDLLSSLRDELSKTGLMLSRAAFSLTNDGNAEAIGWLREQAYQTGRWAIIKLGTGTAGAMIDNGVVRQGPVEIGKLIQNVFAQTLVLQNEDRLPDGLVNEYASQNLLPTVFRYVVKASGQDAPFDVTSFEIAAIAKFFGVNEKESPEIGKEQIDGLIRNLGNRYLYDERLDHLVPRGPFESVMIWLEKHKTVTIRYPEGLDRDWLRYLAVISGALRADLLKIDTALRQSSGMPEGPGGDMDAEWQSHDTMASAEAKLPLAEIRHVVELRDQIGRTRLANALKWLAIAPTEQQDDAQHRWLSALMSDPQVMSPAVILTPEVLKVLKDKAHRLLGEVLDRAGALLADTIALVRATYHGELDGVILGGGVLKEPDATERILRSIKRHLRYRYRLDFTGRSDKKAQPELSTVYCNILKANEEGGKISNVVTDKANDGCIRHAQLMHAAQLNRS